MLIVRSEPMIIIVIIVIIMKISPSFEPIIHEESGTLLTVLRPSESPP